MQNYDVKLGIFRHVINWGDNSRICQGLNERSVYKRDEMFLLLKKIESGRMWGVEYVWDKCYIGRIAKECLFNEDINMGEDICFNLDYILRLNSSDRIGFFDEISYQYYSGRMNSMSNNLIDMKFLEDIEKTYIYLKYTLLKQMIFEGDIKEGYYHLLINKIIGNLYKFYSVYNSTILLETLYSWEEFRYGLSIYKNKNCDEDMEIIELLLHANISEVVQYIKNRIKNELEIEQKLEVEAR